MTEPTAKPVTPARPFGLTPLAERTIRFCVGIGGLLVTYWQSPDDPPWEWLIVWMTCAGSSLASFGDDIRKAAKRGQKDVDQ